jgi:hypothetical protein
MMEITARVEGRYEVHETPFARSYQWQPGYVTLVCDCGQKLILSATSITSTCGKCGVDHSAVITEIQEREGKLEHEVSHPWHHDTQDQADQQLRDEAANPVGSPRRYNDVTSRTGESIR